MRTKEAIDFTKFDVKCSISNPYLVGWFTGGSYYFYFSKESGSFASCRISTESEVGKLLKMFCKPIFLKEYKRYSIIKNSREIIQLCELMQINMVCGTEAYKEYWCYGLPNSEKIKLSFTIIPYLGALKSWYYLHLQQCVTQNGDGFTGKNDRRSAVKRWQKTLSEDVYKFLINSQRNESRNYSCIDAAHAAELYSFYIWLGKNKEVFKYTSATFCNHAGISTTLLDKIRQSLNYEFKSVGWSCYNGPRISDAQRISLTEFIKIKGVGKVLLADLKILIYNAGLEPTP